MCPTEDGRRHHPCDHKDHPTKDHKSLYGCTHKGEASRPRTTTRRSTHTPPPWGSTIQDTSVDHELH